MEKVLNQLIERLQKAHGERLVSVILYGSAASGDRQPKFSDFNVVCVLTQVTPRELRDSEHILRWWRDQGSPSPLLLSEQEFATSSDCFAIEFHDIHLHHRILYGKDVVSSQQLDDSFYRAQVEYELRAKLLRLRQKAAGMLSEKDLLRRLLVDSLSTFCVLFRHALRLHGVESDTLKREIIARARDVFGINPQPFEKLLEIRDERLKPGEVEPVALLASYLEAISVVIDAVDRLEK
jgi:hypothetical protein